MSRRRMPYVGARVEVIFLGASVGGTVEEVADGGRALVVVTDAADVLRFRLSDLTGAFVDEDPVSGARLRFR